MSWYLIGYVGIGFITAIIFWAWTAEDTEKGTPAAGSDEPALPEKPGSGEIFVFGLLFWALWFIALPFLLICIFRSAERNYVAKHSGEYPPGTHAPSIGDIFTGGY